MLEEEPAGSDLPRMTRWVRALSLLLFTGASLALGLWGWENFAELEPYVLRNQLPVEQRWALIALCGASALLLTGTGSGYALLFGLEALERATARLSVLIVFGFLPPLFNYRLWLHHELTFLMGVLACALLAKVLIRPALSQGLYSLGPRWALTPRGNSSFRPGQALTLGQRSLKQYYPEREAPSIRGVSSQLPLGIAILGALSYGAYFSWSTINNHNNFGTSAFDLGIETNLMWNTLHGGPLFRSAPLGGNMMHGGFHQTYFAFVLAPIYALSQRAETLLIIQSCFLGAAGIPLFLLGRKKFGAMGALVLCACFWMYAPLHGANLYDFHYQPFGVFFILLLAYLMESQRSMKIIFPIMLLTMSVREDMGAMMGALGGYFLFSGKRPKAGIVLGLVGSTYFVAQKLFIMPHVFLDGKSSFAFMYQQLLPEGEGGFGGVLKTAFFNPLYTLSTMLEKAKLLYVLQLFVPLCLLPLRRSTTLLLFLPGFVFTLLSTKYPALIMTSFQYTSYFAPMVFLATLYGLAQLVGSSGHHARRRGEWAARLVAITLATILTSVRFGAIFQVETARGAYDPVHLRPTKEGRKDLADFDALASKIPKNTGVVASEWLISHIANRKDAYSLRNGVMDAEYLLFWLHPTKFRGDERPVLLDALFKNPRYEIVERKGMFVLARLSPPGKKLTRAPHRLRQEINRAGKGLPPLPPPPAPSR